MSSRPRRLRVTCVNVAKDWSAPYARIISIGGLTASGYEWKLPQEEALWAIRQRKWSFYLEHPHGCETELIVATLLGHEYLRSAGDDVLSDALLALPECPCYTP